MAPVGQVLGELGVAPDGWDALLVGDGSGISWDRGCGWATVLIDHYTNLRKDFRGAMMPGTVYLSELLAYFHALLWYIRGPGKIRLRSLLHNKPGERVKVHIITDNESVALQGRGEYSRKMSEEVWAGMDAIAMKGYELHWHWMRRDSLGLNQLVDHLSRESRIAVEGVKLPQNTSIYDFNRNGETDDKS
jgi:hypothetical protein